MDHEEHLNDVLNRAFWDAEDKRVKPLADFLAGLPGVSCAYGKFIGGANVPVEMKPPSPDYWSVMIELDRTFDGWKTLGLLVGVVHKRFGGTLTLRMSAPCPHCDGNAWKDLTFWLEGEVDPTAMAADFATACSEVKLGRQNMRVRRG